MNPRRIITVVLSCLVLICFIIASNTDNEQVALLFSIATFINFAAFFISLQISMVDEKKSPTDAGD